MDLVDLDGPALDLDELPVRHLSVVSA